MNDLWTIVLLVILLFEIIYLQVLKSFQMHTHCMLQMENGRGVVFLEATVSGKQHTVKLENVWYIPKLQRNLFSVLASQDKCPNSRFISTAHICNLIVNDKKVIVGTQHLLVCLAHLHRQIFHPCI